jgi:hypothetical protein
MCRAEICSDREHKFPYMMGKCSYFDFHLLVPERMLLIFKSHIPIYVIYGPH